MAGEAMSVVDVWYDRLSGLHRQSVSSVIEFAVALIEAESSLRRSEKSALRRRLGLSASNAKRIKTIGRHPDLVDESIHHLLPSARESLYLLSRLPHGSVRALVDAGAVTPSSTGREIAELLSGDSAAPTHSKGDLLTSEGWKPEGLCSAEDLFEVAIARKQAAAALLAEADRLERVARLRREECALEVAS